MLRNQIFKFSVGLVFIYLSACSFAQNDLSDSNTPKRQFEFAEKLKEEGDYNSAILEYKRLLHLYPDHKLNLRASEEIKRLESASLLRVVLNFIESITQGDYEIAYGYLSKEVAEEIDYTTFADTVKKKVEEMEKQRQLKRFLVKEDTGWKINFPVEFFGIETIQSKEGETKGQLGALRSALSIHYGDTEGTWPRRLEDLTPKYLREIPAEKITGNSRIVTEFDGHGGWWYDKSDGGRIYLNLKGKDSRGREYKSW